VRKERGQVLAKLEEKARELTQQQPIGTEVRYWLGARDPGNPPRTGRIAYAYSVLAGHTVVGWIDTASGCVAATHIEPIGGAT
jgi:hypothetical protein